MDTLLTACICCGRSLGPAETPAFAALQGGLTIALCATCAALPAGVRGRAVLK
jgi:hypothetical protein